MGAIYGLVNVGNGDVLKVMGDRLVHRGRARWEWQADENAWLGCIDHVANTPPPGDSAELRFACDGDILELRLPAQASRCFGFGRCRLSRGYRSLRSITFRLLI